MLLKIPAAGFEWPEIMKKTTKLRNNLEKNPLNLARQGVELEIVPYEVLWGWVKESCGASSKMNYEKNILTGFKVKDKDEE